MLGIREYATHGGARFQAVEDDAIEAWLGGSADATGLIEPAEGAPGDEPTRSLFAFPAEDNFAGVKCALLFSPWTARAPAPLSFRSLISICAT